MVFGTGRGTIMKARYQVKINLKGNTYLELCHGLRDVIDTLEEHINGGLPRKATTSWLSDGEYSMTVSTKDAIPLERLNHNDQTKNKLI